MITIVHGGQTGVDRGAHDAALDNGWKITGFMPKNGRDEEGLIPRRVAQFLQPCDQGGNKARTIANLRIAAALLVIVRDKQDPYATPGTKLTLEHARQLQIPRQVVDPSDEADRIRQWLQVLLNSHVRQFKTPFRLMVAGPRLSKWANGYVEAAGFLRRVKRAFDEAKRPRTGL